MARVSRTASDSTQKLKPSTDLNCLSYVTMDKLTKAQKDEYATAFAILALYDGEVSQSMNFSAPWWTVVLWLPAQAHDPSEVFPPTLLPASLWYDMMKAFSQLSRFSLTVG